jgi:hypothetical protein
VLCVAGVAKLRRPDSAAAALRALGLPSSAVAVRLLAAAELALGVVAVAAPSRFAAGLLAAAYAAFAVVAIALVRRHASCGCFGETEAPASSTQAIISGVIAIVCIVMALAGPHGIGWLLDRSMTQAAVAMLAILASTYAAVLAYTELPRAWDAWSLQ